MEAVFRVWGFIVAVLFQMKDKVIDLISNNQVVVISGATGCGKTTQVPQLILDYLVDIGKV